MNTPTPSKSGFASQFTDMELRWFGADDSMVPRSRAAESLAAKVAGVVGIRPLPEVGTAALELLGASPLGRSALHALVESDIALAAKVVRFASTVRGHDKEPIQGIAQAIDRVGARMLPGLVASCVTDAPFPDPNGAARAIHLHGLGVGVVARHLGDFYDLADLDALYLAGLFHDIGRLLRLQAGETPDLDDPDEEIERMGYDHAMLGAEVLRGWRLPERVVRVVGLHHHPGRVYAATGDLAVRVGIVRIADVLEPLLVAGAPVEVAVERVCGGDAVAAYIDFTSEDLESLWPSLQASHAQAVSSFPARPGGA